MECINLDIVSLILLIPVLLISLSFHEYMHGRVSYMLGDPTPKIMGRLTLNPLRHLDPVGSLVLIITRRIGWAKPVPINPRYYKNPRKGMMLVGLAGPGANVFLALCFSFFLKIFYIVANNMTNIIPMRLLELFASFLYLAVIINLSLAVFNLLPFPPLDGSKILMGFLPSRYDKYFYKLEGPVGMVVIMLLAFTGVLGMIIFPIVNFLSNFLI